MWRVAAAVACLFATTTEGAFLSQSRQSADPEKFARDAWLAAHLKEEFEMKGGKLRPQSGLNIPWDHAESRPRNAKNDCGDVVAANAQAMMAASEAGKMAATR
eukprot:TRINITY_DN112416_c0_g1_i1.p1 TRINITY_DN112416_c0_g1~~TRINITY_DN112416_c0_g1_i1.p1  ORF type:complete len:103 (-),score=23.49 TRINITY_DN112416_c0_g1_i1:159-467(-)